MSQKKSAPQGAEKNLIEANVNTVDADGVCFLDERKNDSERLRVQLKEYRGKTYVDLRVWYTPTDGGNLRPSNKGIMLRPDLAGPLAAALTDAAMAYDGKGVI